jgi:hypothetical protein
VTAHDEADHAIADHLALCPQLAELVRALRAPVEWVECPGCRGRMRYSNIGPDHDGSPDQCDQCDSFGKVPSWVLLLDALLAGPDVRNVLDAGVLQ